LSIETTLGTPSLIGTVVDLVGDTGLQGRTVRKLGGDGRIGGNARTQGGIGGRCTYRKHLILIFGFTFGFPWTETFTQDSTPGVPGGRQTTVGILIIPHQPILTSIIVIINRTIIIVIKTNIIIIIIVRILITVNPTPILTHTRFGGTIIGIAIGRKRTIIIARSPP
jgi:hypothetical protein